MVLYATVNLLNDLIWLLFQDLFGKRNAVAVLILAIIMITVGWRYANGIGSKGTYVSMPTVSRFWMYFPVPLAGVAMLIFELEALYNHIKSFFVKEA